jgi:hypothetical protein
MGQEKLNYDESIVSILLTVSNVLSNYVLVQEKVMNSRYFHESQTLSRQQCLSLTWCGTVPVFNEEGPLKSE